MYTKGNAIGQLVYTNLRNSSKKPRQGFYNSKKKKPRQGLQPKQDLGKVNTEPKRDLDKVFHII